ncbi:MAG: nuclear transport factor 2 family protein [Actinocrinis sp.]
MNPTHPTVRALADAINAGDRGAFLALLAPDATMSDDGTDRDLEPWIDREIFTQHGRMDVESESAGGLSLIAAFRNDRWGAMRTTWTFILTDDGRIERFETGQA